MATNQTKRSDLFKDYAHVRAHNPVVSRSIYRDVGTFSDRQIKKHFNSFRDFVTQAEHAYNGTSPEIEEAVDDYLRLTQAGVNPVEDVCTASEPTLEGKPTETYTYKGDAWYVKIPKTTISTLDELLIHCKVDLTEWYVKEYEIKKWDMAAMPRATGEGRNWSRSSTEPIITELFAVSAEFAKNKKALAIKDEIADIKAEAMKECVYPVQYIPRWTSGESDCMLEINIPDLHAGKLAWHRETGYGNYDIKLAIEVFDAALDALLAQVAHIDFEKIIFVVGNDVLQSDNAAGTTTAGTKVDTDARYHKTYVTARNAHIKATQRLLTLAPVEIISCPGNHDKLSSWHLADSLHMRFFGNPDVTFNIDPTPRKYTEWGQVLLCHTHGHTGKKTSDGYPLDMAVQNPEAWGRTKYREIHTGHLHHKELMEHKGVRIRVLPALCEPDAWHADNAFIGSLRSAEAYVWHKTKGNILTASYFAD